MRYPGGTSLSTPSVSPAFVFAAPTFTANLASALALLPGNVLYSQGRADLWAATPPLGEPHLRLGAEGLWSGSARSDGSRTATAQGILEALWSTPAWGIGVGGGPSWGWILAQPPSVTALHLRARAWWQRGIASTTLNVEPMRFFGAWFTDVTAGLTVAPTSGKLVASFSVGGRLSRAYGSKGVGSAFLQYFATPALAFEGGGGAYLSDPYQGFPRAGYIAAGIRWFPNARPAGATAPGNKAPPLVPDRRGDSLFVRFRMPGAKSVAIAGEWNRWTPAALQGVGNDLWEGAVTLAPGTYRFNLLVDGTDWVVPAGVATLSDGLGGLVALLVVP
ncbi:MAG TPA: glycogen-binding domain-containing protein [Gemmatimonadales bacterium]